MNSSSLSSDIREIVDGIMGVFSDRDGNAESHQPSSAQARSAVLNLLKSEPRTGLALLSDLKAASAGSWAPGANEIYPILEKLVEDGFASTKAKGERKVFSLTENGVLEAQKVAESEAAQKPKATGQAANNRKTWDTSVLKAGSKIGHALSQVAQSGTPDQQRRAAELVDETRRKIYAILAES